MYKTLAHKTCLYRLTKAEANERVFLEVLSHPGQVEFDRNPSFLQHVTPSDA